MNSATITLPTWPIQKKENLRDHMSNMELVLDIPTEAEHKYNVTPFKDKPQANTCETIILAVAHPEFLRLGATGIHSFGKAGDGLYDVKSLIPNAETNGRM
ncbi:MAG: hypothetical protein Q7T18_08165 [Sedimentisphaerales bacterium]|nr:hypothetical protein [Sedimentisphaerales bacterium]